MNTRWSHSLLMAVAAALAGSSLVVDRASAQSDDQVETKFVASGVTRKMGGYLPLKAQMQPELDAVKELPDDLESPQFGFLEDGEQKWAFVLDEPEEGDARLIVDQNADGDLTNDAPVKWTLNGNYSGNVMVKRADGEEGLIQLYRFNPKDPGRASYRDKMMYYYDYGYQLSFSLDGKPHVAYLTGSPQPETRLATDRDENGRISHRLETMTEGTPFNFTGTTYVLNYKDGGFQLAQSAEAVDPLPLPPDLAIGKKALEFDATTIDGESIQFPGSFKGKVVMLDFWATWCGPCVGEIPNMQEAYAKWHNHGFEILGVSFDREGMEEKLQQYRKDREIPWPQIYEGKYWETSLGLRHDVAGIPFVLVVDGDTGEILGTSREARGKGLSRFIGQQLLKKGTITQQLFEQAFEESSPEDDDQ